MMKKILVMTLLLAGSVQAQTGLIAHKSHSGTASTYFLADPGNFGEPPARIQKVIWINDTTVATQMDQWGSHRIDTLYNHPIFSDPNMPVDSMKHMYYDAVEFENFDTKKVMPVAPVPQMEERSGVKKTETPPPTDKTTTKKSKKKKSNLFWLWIVGGGTFAGILLVSRKKANIHYA